MRINSEVLANLAQGVAKAVPESQDATLKIPNTIVPNLELQHPTYVMGSGSIANQSVVNHSVVRVANGGASQSTLVQFSQGLWDVSVTAHYYSNYSIASNEASAKVEVLAPSGSPLFNAILVFNANICNVCNNARARFLFRTSDYTLRLNVAANGAGQEQVLAAGCVASKLL